MKQIDFIKDKWERLKAWEQNPYAKPAEDKWEEHCCKNCGSTYVGDYCPACGQSAATNRFKISNLFTNVLNVWGWGNRSLPRTLLHLLTRPGFMIRDYLAGKRQPFFPPVKMLFIIASFFAIISFVITPNDASKKETTTVEKVDSVSKSLEKENIKIHNMEVSFRKEDTTARKSLNSFAKVADYLNDENHRAMVLLFFHTALAFVTFLLFRKDRNDERLTLVEHFFIQMFVACQLLALGCIFTIVTWRKGGFYSFPLEWVPVVIAIDYLQVFGGKKRYILPKILLSLFLAVMLCLILGIAVIAVMTVV